MIVANAFAESLRRLHDRQGGEARAGAAVLRLAADLWQAVADGHACIAIGDAESRDLLAASPVVATAGAAVAAGTARAAGAAAAAFPPAAAVASAAKAEAAGQAPLVLDGDTLYLQRLWLAEVRLALRLHSLDAPAPLADPACLEAVLDQVAPASGVDPLQRVAIRAALTRRLAIVTGGPGTGKTTTIARLLVACTRLAPGMRVAIAAPTGKAAARLAQALATQVAQLDPDGLLARNLPTAGLTVHRLLGLQGDELQRAVDPPRYDLVIVDEASMLDLELARALAESVPDTGRLVLAGDQDQLASVEAGAVFAEACVSGLAGVTRLERNYRQAGAPALTALSGWLRDRCSAVAGAGGDGASAGPPFDPETGVERFAPHGAEPIAAQALARWEPALTAIATGRPAAQVLAAFDGHRVLSAMREGPLGTRALNDAIAARLRRRVGARPGTPWYPGRLVIVTRNRPELGLSNGDVGVCLPAPGSAPDVLAVAFDAGGGSVRWQPVRQMPGHDDAFAITVHKSQGSEFDSVALVPGPREHPLNTRELLYTGATRARVRLALWADVEALDDGARRRSARHGRLADRIAALRAAGGQVT